MAAIETWLRQPAAQAVGWALLQFVWQGAAVGVLTALALLALRRSASDVRYVVASIGLALMLTLPIVTRRAAVSRRCAPTRAPRPASRRLPGVRARRDGAAIRPRSPGAAAAGRQRDGRRRVRARRSRARSRRSALEALLPALILVWIAGVSLLSLRLLTGWIWVQRLRTRGDAPAARRAGSAWRRGSRAGCTSRAPITLLESTLVDVPTVIGFLKPVVLLPASALAGADAAADRSDPRARARAHPPARLPGEPAADARRDGALLSPGGLVALAPHPHRARELLRRSRRQPLRRSGRLRERAGRSRSAALASPRRRITSRWRRPAGRSCSASAGCSARPRRIPAAARRGSPAASRCCSSAASPSARTASAARRSRPSTAARCRDGDRAASVDARRVSSRSIARSAVRAVVGGPLRERPGRPTRRRRRAAPPAVRRATRAPRPPATRAVPPVVAPAAAAPRPSPLAPPAPAGTAGAVQSISQHRPTTRTATGAGRTTARSSRSAIAARSSSPTTTPTCAQLSAGGWLKISDGRGSAATRSRSASAAAQLDHHYYVNALRAAVRARGPRLAAREPAEVRPQHRHRRARRASRAS